mmetsp:Transcript_35580/g.79025  ORF Transcript_35580/g.79025 Transcript_35580/m.79025 type:complete len:237 (-) Transcript_35580:1502-2212(-)
MGMLCRDSMTTSSSSRLSRARPPSSDKLAETSPSPDTQAGPPCTSGGPMRGAEPSEKDMPDRPAASTCTLASSCHAASTSGTLQPRVLRPVMLTRVRVRGSASGLGLSAMSMTPCCCRLGPCRADGSSRSLTSLSPPENSPSRSITGSGAVPMPVIHACCSASTMLARWEGSLSRSFRRKSVNSALILVWGGMRSSCRLMLSYTMNGAMPLKGSSPKTHMYRVTPSAHMSSSVLGL